MKIRKGDIVKLKDGRIGIIVYRKSNQEIYINSEHYNIAVAEKNKQERDKLILGIRQGLLGCNIDTEKDQIIENLSKTLK